MSYGVTPRGALGLEYYGAAGPVSGFYSLSQQQHELFPVLDLDLADDALGFAGVFGALFGW